MPALGPPVDVMLCPINMNTLAIAEAVERALQARGLSVGYLRVRDDVGHTKWLGDAGQRVRWTTIPVGADLEVHELAYAVQMLRALRHVTRYDLRRHFRLFAPFIDTGWHPRLFNIACARQGIPSVLLQEGTVASSTAPHVYPGLRHAALRQLKRGREALFPELFGFTEHGMHTEYACVWGPAKAESLMVRKKPPGNIFVTGNPLFDSLIPKLIDPQPRSRTIVFAHQDFGYPGYRSTLVRWWRAVVAGGQAVGAKVIFKLHPRSAIGVDELRRALGGPDEADVEFVCAGDVQDMVASAGVFVTAHSTSAYRALVEGVPIVLLDGLDPYDRLDLDGNDAAVLARGADQVVDAIRAAFDDRAVRVGLRAGVERAIAKHLYRVDGRSSERVADALIRLCR